MHFFWDLIDPEKKYRKRDESKQRERMSTSGIHLNTNKPTGFVPLRKERNSYPGPSTSHPCPRASSTRKFEERRESRECARLKEASRIRREIYMMYASDGTFSHIKI
ncbi:hypothetical protein LOTGIDRAFT_162455 [Lottia gigantea]|uniref:Uncharacterized protein n=1 Tax=Lottia gigantea TaxID=225164 RepID=V3ZMF3_LOTGI|nr:hypothetical protein LOTGIDRAFT_162455 [Lottia gigantea]ESO92548.1 hypothetical protein LOTGIDRAFT_162455 [Lottia gigantea]